MSGPAATPKLRDDLIVSEQESGGQTVFVLKDPITRRYFRLREPEYYLVRQFDGSRDFEAVARRFREKFNLNVTPEQVGAFASKLQSLAFFEGTRAEYETSAARHRVEKRKSLLSRVLFIKLKAFNPEKLLDVLIKIARPFFHPIAVAGMIVLVIAGFGVWSANMSHFSLRLAEIFSVPSLLVIFLSFATIIFIHEFAHALTCRYFGGQVSEIGFLLLFFQICFYANLSDSWLFPRKSQRMAVIWAGVFFQMVLFALAVFGWRLTVIGTPVNQFFWLTANVCLIMLLFNINPLIKLDGYYFLSELIDVPNLRAKSFAWLKNRIKRQIGLDVKPFESSRRERRIFFWYVLFASLFSALLIGYIAFLVQRLLVEWLGGFGFLLFLLFVAVIIRRPVTQAAEFVFSREVIRALVSKTRNLVTAGVLIVVIVVFFFLIPFPRRVGGPVAVKPIAEFSVTMLPGQGQLQLNIKKRGKAQEYQTEYIQLASTDMSVLKLTPLVKEGDLVVNGDTLAAILSNQISASLDAARAELERLKGELALAKSPPKPEEIATAEAEVTAAEAKRDKLENEVERSKQLFKKSLISKQELEDVEAQLRVAVSDYEHFNSRLELLKSPPKAEEIQILESKIATQEAQIKYLTTQEAAQVIVSPIAGEVTALYRNNLLIRVSTLTAVEASIPVTDNYLEFVKENADVTLKARSFPSLTFDGTVTRIARSADSTLDHSDDRARFAVYAYIMNEDGLLRDGMSGYAKISCGHAFLAKIIFEKVRSIIRVEFWSWW